MNNTIQLYIDEKKEIKGYPITSADRVIDENGVSIKERLDTIATKDELNDKADKTAIPTKTSQLENDSDYLKSTDTIDANSLNGKRFSEPITKQEYDSIANKDSNTI